MTRSRARPGGQHLRAARRCRSSRSRTIRRGQPESHRGKRQHLDARRRCSPRPAASKTSRRRSTSTTSRSRTPSRRSNPLFIYSKCFNANGTSNPTFSINDPGGFCNMIGRQPQTGERDTVQAPYVNSGALQTLGSGHRRQLGDGHRRRRQLVLHQLPCSRARRVQHPGCRRRADSDVRDTLSTTCRAQYEYKLNNTFGYDFGGGKTNLGLQLASLAGDPVGDCGPQSGRRRRSSAPMSYDVFGTCSRASRSTIGSSSAAVSTTCSTRIRRSSGAIRLGRAGRPGPVDSNNDVTRTRVLRRPRTPCVHRLKMSF